MILDAVMPQMGGFEAIAAIRSRPGLSTTPAIVVSGLTEDVETTRQRARHRCRRFVVKPYDHRELLARVRAQLRVVDAWRGHLSTMTSDLREVRRRITDSARVASPTDTARSLKTQFPAELGCSTLLTVDSAGGYDWAPHPFRPEDVAALDLRDLPLRPHNDLPGGEPAGVCPLGGAGTGGILLTQTPGRGTTAGLSSCWVVRTDPLRRSRCSPMRWQRRAGRCSVNECGTGKPTASSRPGSSGRSSRGRSGPSSNRSSTCDRVVIAQEVLARFDDGTAPGEVFRAASRARPERVQLEVALVSLALDQAVALPDGDRIHVNVSPATAMTAEIPDLVATSTRNVSYSRSPKTCLFSSSNAETLRGSIPASCLLAADDVGAGYAGMAQLLEYRPDIVKIDRAVVTRRILSCPGPASTCSRTRAIRSSDEVIRHR